MTRFLAAFLIIAVGATAQVATNVQRIAAGRFTNFGIEPNGKAWGWGSNGNGEAGVGFAGGSPILPMRLAVTTPVVGCAGGTLYGLYLLAGGTLMAAGGNSHGQFGNGTSNGSTVPIAIPGISGVAAVSAGDETSFALKSNGTVWAWGRGDFGQLGNGIGQSSSIPVLVGNGLLNNVVAIDAGDHHCLALLANGQVWAWGWNSNGQIGDGTTISRNLPVQVFFPGSSPIVGVSAGEQSSGALRADGSVWCWGDGGAGQMGNGAYLDSHVPTPSNAVTGVVELAFGARHVLARTAGGTLLTWGSNQFGGLGNGTNAPSNVPVAVAAPTNVVAIAASYTSVALKDDGTVWLWGYGNLGQIGNGQSNAFNGTPMSPQLPYLGGTYLASAGDTKFFNGSGLPVDLLSINGATGVQVSNGFHTHRVDVPVNAPVTIAMAQPPLYPFPAPFAIFGFIGVPDITDAVVLPYINSPMAFTPYTLNPGYPGAFLLTTSYGFDPAALVPSTPTPWSYPILPIGLPFPFQLTFQGIAWASFSDYARVTNGVILNVY